MLPDIDNLRLLHQSLALLDAILASEWEYRYYSFNAHWNPNEALASMRNGSGDEYFCSFNRTGAILKGFAHESAMSPYRFDPPQVWPGVLDRVPPSFASFLSGPWTEPSDWLTDTTFIIWRTYQDTAWQCGDIQFPDDDYADGSADLLSLLDGNPQTYHTWAEEYYEHPVNIAAVAHIYEHKPITDEVIKTLNPHLSLDDLNPDMIEIGYNSGR